MNTADLEAIIHELRSEGNPDRMADAATRLHKSATAEDIPRLRELLDDESFFVREAAAWPLTELAGLDHLPDLLRAFQRGLDEGYDNDGFSLALVDLAQTDPVRVAQALDRLARSGDKAMRENAQWLLTFCVPEQDA